jgi:hypothetical protein
MCTRLQSMSRGSDEDIPRNLHPLRQLWFGSTYTNSTREIQRVFARTIRFVILLVTSCSEYVVLESSYVFEVKRPALVFNTLLRLSITSTHRADG